MLTTVASQLQFLFRQHPRTAPILKCIMTVASDLGSGLSESMYQNALKVQLQRNNLPFEAEHNIVKMYHGQQIGLLRADLFVDKQVVIENKVLVKNLRPEDGRQLHNYVIGLGAPLGMLVNFRKRFQPTVPVMVLSRWETIASLLADKSGDDNFRDAVQYVAGQPSKQWMCVTLDLPTETPEECKLRVLSLKGKGSNSQLELSWNA